MTTIDQTICEQGYFILDNFLEHQDFTQLLNTARQLHEAGKFRSAKIGQDRLLKQRLDIRGDDIYWLEDEDSGSGIQQYLAKMMGIARILNQTLFLGLQEFETHFAIYKAGTFYRKHIDQFKNNKRRQISCVYYLNEHWQESHAGELKLYDREDNLLTKVTPIANRLICFQSDLPHEVCETNHLRYSIAGWMKTPANPIFYQV